MKKHRPSPEVEEQNPPQTATNPRRLLIPASLSFNHHTSIDTPKCIRRFKDGPILIQVQNNARTFLD